MVVLSDVYTVVIVFVEFSLIGRTLFHADVAPFRPYFREIGNFYLFPELIFVFAAAYSSDSPWFVAVISHRLRDVCAIVGFSTESTIVVFLVVLIFVVCSTSLYLLYWPLFDRFIFF